MQKAILALVAAALISTLSPAFAISSQRHPSARTVPMYGTFHDIPSNFVFVKLPTGWDFVGMDAGGRHHKVYRDGPTGFVFVKLSTGWKFVSPVHTRTESSPAS